MRNAAAVAFLATCLPQAYADPACLQTFNVQPGKTVSSFPWLPGASPGNPGKMSCVSLELTRQAFFVANRKLINLAALSNAGSYEAEVDRSLRLLDEARQELDAKLSQDAKLDAIRIAYRVLKYEFGKASALIGCLAPEPTASKAFCAIGIAILAEDTVSVLDGSIARTEMSEGAKKLSSRVTELNAEYAKLKEKRLSFQMGTAEQQYSRMFLGMCQAVRSQCL